VRPRAAPPRHPGHRAFPRLRANRGGAHCLGSRAPRCIESRKPRAFPSSRRTCVVHAAVTKTSRASRPYLRLPTFPPRAHHRRCSSPPRPPWPDAGEPPLRVSPARSNRPKLLPRIYRDLHRRLLPGIANPSPVPQPAAAATTARPRRSLLHADQPLQSPLAELLGVLAPLVGQGRLAIAAGEPAWWREGICVRIGIFPRA
jgi:hypothetical protein